MQHPKRHRDINQLAAQIVAITTGQESEPEETPEKKYAREFARKGGLVGGKARAKALSPRRRKQIAKQGAEARWKKKDQSKPDTKS